VRQIDKIIIHCADTPAHMDIGVQEIARWHRDRGWNDVGYHWVIRRNGTIEKGRDEAVQGAHVRGHNHDSIGVCLVGGKGGFNFNWRQVGALRNLITELLGRYPGADVLGHRELDPGKECPCFDVRAYFEGWLR
jgi:N-acetylmuramoyl-L-alanine amidase